MPEPDTPTMATLPPVLISRLTPDTMSSVPSVVLTLFERLAAETMTSFRGVDMFGLWSRLMLLCVLLLPLPAAARTLLVVGDSLSASYGMDISTGWVAQLQARLDRDKRDYRVVNASISGDTTANGLTRLPKLLATHQPEILIIALGGNDGLRGLSLAQMKHNITAMVVKAKAAGAKVLLLGVHLPPNYGKTYTEGFRNIYSEVAAEHQIELVPFILEGVALEPGMMQPDGIHPAAAAQGRVLENVWECLQEML